MADLRARISELWDRRADLGPGDAETAATVHIGSRCMITQGARVGRGAVLGEGRRHDSAQLNDMLREHGVAI